MRSPSTAEIVGGEMSPQGCHWQGAVLVTWQLGQCQPDVTTLFPKHSHHPATLRLHLGQNQGAGRDLCFVNNARISGVRDGGCLLG